MTESNCCVQVVCGRHTALIEEYGIFLKAQQLLAQVLPSRSSHTARRLSAALAESRQGRHTNDDSPDSGREAVESELNTSGEEVPTGMQPVPVPAALLRGWLQRQERYVERREEARDSPGDGGRRSASPRGGKATHVEKSLTMQRGGKEGEEGEAPRSSSSTSPETAAAAGPAPIRQSSLTVQPALEYASATYGAVHITTWTHYEEAKAIHCAEHATAAAPCMLLTVVVLWLHEGVMYRLAPSGLAEVDHELHGNPERGDDAVPRPSHRHVSAASSPQSQQPQQQHFPSPSPNPSSSSSSLFTCLLQLEYPPGTLLPQRLPVPLSEPLLTRLELVELVRRTANIRRHHALRVAYQVHPRHYAQPRLTSAAAAVLRGDAAGAAGGRRGNGQRAVRTSTLSGPPLHAIESEAAVAVFVRAILTHGSAAVRVVAVERRRAAAPATLPSVEVSVDGDDNHSEEREGLPPQRTHASATAAQKRSASSAAVPSTQMYDVQPAVSNAATTLQPRASATAPSPATLRSPYTIEPLAVHDAVFREATPTRSSSSSSSCSSASRQSDSAAAVAAVDGHVRHRHASSPLEADLEVAREDCRDGDDCEEEEEDTAQQQQQANDVELSEAKSDTADSPESFALKKPDKDMVESTKNNTNEKGADGDDDAPPFARGLGSARVLAMCSSTSTTTATTLTASRPSVLASAPTNSVITGGAATAAVDLQQRTENHGVPSKGAGRGFDTTASTSETCSHHSHTREPVSISPYDVALQALDPHHLYSASACGDGGGGSRNASHGRDDRASAPRQQHSSQTRSPPPPPPLPVATANAAIDTSKTGEGPATERKDDGRVEKQAEAPQHQHQHYQGKENVLPAPPAIPRPPGPDDDFGMTWRNPELYGPTARPSAGQPTAAGFTLHDNDAPTSMSSRPSPQQREAGWGHKEGAVVGAQEAQLVDTHSDTAAPLAVAASTPPVQRATSSIGSSSAPDRHSLVFVRYEAEPTAVFVSGPVVPAVLQQLQDVIYRRCCAHLSRDVDSPRPRFHAAGGGGGGGGRGTEAARNSLGVDNQESDSAAAGGVEYVLPLYAYTFTRTEEKALECCIAEVMAVYQGLEQLPAMEAEEWVHIAASTADGPAAAPATAAA